MTDLLRQLSQLSRPGLLIRAARHGVDEYRRDVHLRRILGDISLPRPDSALARLLEVEAQMDQLRRAENAAYSCAHHVEVLIAIMGEARITRASTREPVVV